MNVVFWIIVIATAVLVWFASSFLYKYIGKFFCKLFNDAKDEINEEKEK